MTSLPEFLAKHTIKKEDKDKLKSTHTRMPDKELNIYPGSYHIPVEMLPTFYKLYYDYLFVQGHKEYLTEKQQGKCIAVDFDLKYTFETTSRQHTKEEITDIVCIYLEEFKEYFVFTEDTNFDVFVFEKPNVNRLADESLTKDGIHIIFGIQADYKIQSLIRKKMIETLPKCLDLPLINTWENVLDEGISKGHTNWTLYGSRKPNHEAYELTHHYEITFDNSDENFMMIECKVSDFDLKQDFAKLSVQYDNPVYSYTQKGLTAIEARQQKQMKQSNQKENNTPEKLLELIKCIKLNPKQRKDRTLWMNICSFMINNNLKEDVWFEFCDDNKLNLDAEKQGLYKYLKPHDIEIFYLQKLAKETNNKSYKEWYCKYHGQQEIQYEKNEDIEKMLLTSAEYDVAEYFKNKFGKNFKCIDVKNKTTYFFTDKKLWELDDSATNIRLKISNEIVNDLNSYITMLKQYEEDEEIKKKLGLIATLIISLKKTTFKDHVVREIFDFIKDTNFINQLNHQEYIIPCKPNHLYNIKTNESVERDESCNFSFECNAIYLPRPFDIKTDENYKTIDKYFNDLFCGNLQTKKAVVSILKNIFRGKPTRYLYIFSGSGSNGKSLLLNLIKAIFGGFIETISKLVIIKQKGNFSNVLNTEMEKLQHIRVGYVSELSDEDELNIKSVKEITGGDPIDLRGMRETNKTIIPTCSLLAITNQKPKIAFSNDDNDKAIINRLVNVPFKATFENNTEFESKMMALKNELFNYIMTEGELFDNITPLLSEEMIFEKNEYVNENKMDELKAYISSHLTDCENTIEDKPIILNDFRNSFYEYVKCNNLRYPNLTSTKFTKTCKSFGLNIKESNHKNRIYNKKWLEEFEEDEDLTTTLH